ncbi:ribonuclease BN (tRNA processing enzyme) [Saccharothrix ecbatanensis]|uniref:Ribonuclease BN (tRNA processing enzyme) n=1 Tax=Saccharothrix ecbatanensis TaxID=1105145 RepID=A0A7W9HTA3_9PSEU|nr:MBL fold metallo-hydrolase [Saccharothrix ecbatanensis]MBB5808054.1 ribonuclease BN (tRNA processing enzyme) [Saccharothrix ecbatanensis]
MLLTILGCSGSLPGPHGPASGYLVEADGCRLAIELGSGVLAALQAHHDPFSLDGLLFSHLHPDHCSDFTTLTVTRRYHTHPPYDTRKHRLPVHGPSEAADRFARAYAETADELLTTDLSDVFEFLPLTGDAVTTIGPFEITAVRVDHPTEAYGFRITTKTASLAYTGDTGPCDALLGLAQGVDVLLSEATWTHADDRPLGRHLSGVQAGRLAADAGVGRLLLTHIAPWTDRDAVLAEARGQFSGPVDVVAQGDRYAVDEPVVRVIGGHGN